MSIWIFIAIIFIIDRLLKYLSEYKLGMGRNIEVLKDKVYIRTVKNTGAAWSVMSGKAKLLALITAPMLCLIGYYTLKYSNTNQIIITYSLGALLSGGLSNFYDRVVKGYVIDYIYIKFKGAPIFNVADVFIFLGNISLIIYVLLPGTKI